MLRRLRTLACVLVPLLAMAACVPQYYDRSKQKDLAMEFDADPGWVGVRDKIEAAREGAFGGFGAARAGGCACQ